MLKQIEDGTSIEEVCRKIGVSQQAVYCWKQRYGGTLPSEVRRLEQFEDESARLEQLVTDLSLCKILLQDVLKESSDAGPRASPGGRAMLELPGLGVQRL